MNHEWQEYFMNIAEAVSKKSKDPSSKVGAVLVRPDKTIASVGFNGFPRRIEDNIAYLTDTKYREAKLRFMVHAEKNAINFNRDNTTQNYIMFVSRHPCRPCALEIACTDINYVYYRHDEDFMDRWADSVAEAKEVFEKAGISLVRYG